MHQIEVDSEVWRELQQRAEPLVDDSNAVLRRLFGLDGTDPDDSPVPSPPRPGGSPFGARAPLGSLLPESEYALPILEELAARGGRAAAREITHAVGERLKDKLTELDRQRVRSGDIRWENRVHFMRLRLREQGLLKSGSPRGTWELTEQGRRAAKRGRLE